MGIDKSEGTCKKASEKARLAWGCSLAFLLAKND